MLSHSSTWAVPYPSGKGRGGSRRETEKKRAGPPASAVGIQSLYGTCDESEGMTLLLSMVTEEASLSPFSPTTSWRRCRMLGSQRGRHSGPKAPWNVKSQVYNEATLGDLPASTVHISLCCPGLHGCPASGSLSTYLFQTRALSWNSVDSRDRQPLTWSLK